MKMKKNKNIFLVIIDDCYDYESDIKVFAFTTHEKATEFYNKKIKIFKFQITSLDIQYFANTITITEPESFCAFDEGWYNKDHYKIYIEEKEVL